MLTTSKKKAKKMFSSVFFFCFLCMWKLIKTTDTANQYNKEYFWENAIEKLEIQAKEESVNICRETQMTNHALFETFESAKNKVLLCEKQFTEAANSLEKTKQILDEKKKILKKPRIIILRLKKNLKKAKISL
ncbi:hypothetical protein EDEG_02466 [Edhazardia aedis USNM 41457]|uniref:Uncharacterized protein n=1 Tax=Edhazardia aedis (strain USNM 41457) TaxID=1003232 RepID=J9D5V5_EDHAE|nr:hypothetical protein EDEG_02466 [Edhazardia aedis USNM 41457]|eukprot:EJW03161.1 hypothetical protein EDEG_02466 [Edhazardia aedis USNM 41457]